MPGSRVSVVGAVVLLLMACGSPDSPRRVEVEVPEDCRVVDGPEPWVFVNGGEEPEPCVRVEMGQNLQIWNKGFGPTTVWWFGARLLVSDTYYETGPLAASLTPGIWELSSSDGTTLIVVDDLD